MWFFWVFSLLPIFIGVFFLFLGRKVCWQEWLISALVALGMAGIFQVIATKGMTDDIEMWSGYGTSGRQFSRWKEYYEYAVYRTEHISQTCTDSEGKSYDCSYDIQVFDHWEPDTRWHQESWTFYTTLEDHEITQHYFDYLCKKYGGVDAVPGKRTTWEHNSRMIEGDPNDYVCPNKTGWIEPVISQKHFENRVKAAPTLFSFTQVPTNISVYAWPEIKDWSRSERVMGTASTMVSPFKWDQLNAVLGAVKKVNLIIVGYPGGTSMDMAKWQEAKWVGGKKNDLVLCYAGGSKTNSAEWAYVFGWSEKAICKINLQDILTQNPINEDILDKIGNEVKSTYIIKDWSKFDYISIDPPAWSYWVYLIVMVVVQGGLYVFFHLNEFDNVSENESLDFKRKFYRYWNRIKSRFVPGSEPCSLGKIRNNNPSVVSKRKIYRRY